MTKYLIEFEKFRPEDDQDLFKAVDAFTRENFATVEFLKPGRDKKGDFYKLKTTSVSSRQKAAIALRYFQKSMITTMAAIKKR